MTGDLKRKTATCFLKILSPIHVGCDEVYEPTGFVVDEAGRSIVSFEPMTFFSEMPPEDRKQFSDICCKGTISAILELYKFMKTQTASGRSVPVSADFISHYNQATGLNIRDEHKIQQELNRFTIERTAFLPGSGQPYIPGSSVKGALRTAYLNRAAGGNKNLRVNKGKFGGSMLEKDLLKAKGIENDPFRLVKVSDFMPVGEAETRIVYAVNEKKNPNQFDARGPYQILEVIQPGAVFYGEIVVEEKHPQAPIERPVLNDALFSASNQFYSREKEREDKDLQRIGVSVIPGISPEKIALLRIGRHSGAESVTIDGYRSILIRRGMGQKSEDLDHATTLWLASEYRKPAHKQGLRAFGWAELHDAQIEIEKAKQAEAKKKAEAEAAAKLAAMPPEDRMILEVRDPAVTENRVVEIYKGIGDFPEEKKPALAEALKKYWQKHNKWTKKQCTKKQWKKVGAVKKILGE